MCKDPRTPPLTAGPVTAARTEKQQNVHHERQGYRSLGAHKGILLLPKEKWNNAIWGHMAGPAEHYTL